MIYKIELARSGRSVCKKCRERILEKEPRGVTNGGFYCHKCIPNKLKIQINEIKNLLKYFKILMEKNKKQMILNRL